jgi:hydroxyacylglutathione hydrolase
MVYIPCAITGVFGNIMILEQITSEGLAHHSYYIASGRSAAVIDPRRDSEIYLRLARENGQEITHIFETHRNEDYVSGATGLAARCGASICHGSATPFRFGRPVSDGDEFAIGDLTVRVLETPGHTLDSISLVVTDRKISRGPYIVFTGDALFAGDVGRTDLISEIGMKKAAGLLYDSLVEKILPLGDSVLVCPAHGAGSVCGIDIADHPVTTLGYERETNPFLSLNREQFVDKKCLEHNYYPPYFKTMEQKNIDGAGEFCRLPDLAPLSPAQIKEKGKNGAQLLDIRAPTSYAGGHIPGSLCIWREGLPAFTGWFLNYDDPIVIIDDFNLDPLVIVRHFIRLGYENISGYLAGGFPAWMKSGEEIALQPAWSVHALKELIDSGPRDHYLVDVRDIHNRQKVGHIGGDHHIYVGELPGRIGEVPRDADVVIYCDAGFKGCLAGSILERAGYRSVTNILGGMTGWIAAGFPVEKDE